MLKARVPAGVPNRALKGASLKDAVGEQLLNRLEIFCKPLTDIFSVWG